MGKFFQVEGGISKFLASQGVTRSPPYPQSGENSVYAVQTQVNFHLNWLNWFHCLILEGGLLLYSDRLHDFLLPFLDVYKDIYMNSFSFD